MISLHVMNGGAVQIWINGKFYAIHAAYCWYRFLAWAIFEGDITQIEVAYFIVKEALNVYFTVLQYLIMVQIRVLHLLMTIWKMSLVKGIFTYLHISLFSLLLNMILLILAIMCMTMIQGVSDWADSTSISCLLCRWRRGLATYNHFNCYDVNRKE